MNLGRGGYSYLFVCLFVCLYVFTIQSLLYLPVPLPQFLIPFLLPLAPLPRGCSHTYTGPSPSMGSQVT